LKKIKSGSQEKQTKHTEVAIQLWWRRPAGRRKQEVGGWRLEDEGRDEDYGSRKRIDLIEQIAVNEP